MKYNIFLRAESAAIFLFLIALYLNFELSWTTFLIFILVPDISIIGYLKGPKVGAYVYNFGHNYAVPIFLVIIAMATDSVFAATLSAIWAMHIAIDRVLGFGLKLGKGFKHTHLNK